MAGETRQLDPGGKATGERRSSTGELIFLAVLLAYGLALAVTLGELSPGARLFPLIVLCGLGALWAIKLAATLAPAALRRVLDPQGMLPRAPAARATGQSAGPPAWAVWAWVGGTMMLMLAVGFLAGAVLAVAVYLRAVAGTSWRAAIVAAALTGLFVYLVFGRVMRIDLAAGLPLFG